MKKVIAILVLLVFSFSVFSQKEKFNKKLFAYCYRSTIEFNKIPPDRKTILDSIAKDLMNKDKIVFTCFTNTRRTILSQTWLQTAFYYYGIPNKMSFSYGDTVSEVATEVVAVLGEAGFHIEPSQTTPIVWAFYIGEKNTGHVIYSKRELDFKDDGLSVVVSVCTDTEPNSIIKGAYHKLEYISPVFEKNKKKRNKAYIKLNRKISSEMMYVGFKLSQLMAQQ